VQDSEQPLISHLVELRDRLLRIVLAIAVVFVVLIPFSNTLFTKLSGPLLVHMPEGTNMIAIEVASPFLIPFRMLHIVQGFLLQEVINSRLGVLYSKL